MLTKTTAFLAAALIVGTASAAFANDNSANSGETGGSHIGPLGQCASCQRIVARSAARRVTRVAHTDSRMSPRIRTNITATRIAPDKLSSQKVGTDALCARRYPTAALTTPSVKRRNPLHAALAALSFWSKGLGNSRMMVGWLTL
jgi:hypothetical protein